MADALTPFEIRFAQEFIRDLDAREAAFRAGAPWEEAGGAASAALAKPAMHEAIARAHASRPQPPLTNAMRVVAEHEKIAFADIGAILPWDGDEEALFVAILNLSPEERAAIAEIRRLPGGGLRVRMHSKPKALEKLARHYKIDRDDLARNEPELSADERCAQVRDDLEAVFGPLPRRPEAETTAAATLRLGEARFVGEFIRDLDAREAAICAGARAERAALAAGKTLAKPAVQEAIARAHAARPQPAVTAARRIVAELQKIAYADAAITVARVSEGECALTSLREFSPDQRVAICEITRLPGGGLRVRTYSRLDALDRLARYFRVYRDEPAQLDPALSEEERNAGVRRSVGEMFHSIMAEAQAKHSDVCAAREDEA